jgi:hypothetical protein
VNKSKSKYVLAALVSLLLLVGITVGGYQLHWWLRDQDANRSAQINQNSYGRQNALTEAVLREARDLTDQNIPAAQRTAIVAQLCDNAAKLTGSITLPASTQALIAKECS